MDSLVNFILNATTNGYYAELATNNNYDKDAGVERECETPIYGSDEPDDHMYTTPGELLVSRARHKSGGGGNVWPQNCERMECN